MERKGTKRKASGIPDTSKFQHDWQPYGTVQPDMYSIVPLVVGRDVERGGKIDVLVSINKTEQRWVEAQVAAILYKTHTLIAHISTATCPEGVMPKRSYTFMSHEIVPGTAGTTAMVEIRSPELAPFQTYSEHFAEWKKERKVIVAERQSSKMETSSDKKDDEKKNITRMQTSAGKSQHDNLDLTAIRSGAPWDRVFPDGSRLAITGAYRFDVDCPSRARPETEMLLDELCATAFLAPKV